jgi:hypothetical protein
MKTKMKKTIYTLIAIIGFANFTMAQVPNYVPKNGLIAWYPFSGNANDQSSNLNNGTAIGASLTTDRNGNENSAYNFSNVGDRIPIPSINCNNILSYSVSGWFKKINQNEDGTIFGQSNGCNGSNGLRLFVGTDNKLFWQSESSIPDCKSKGVRDHLNNYSDNTWHFFVVTFNGSNGTMYSSQYKIYIDNIWVSSSFLDSAAVNGANTGTFTAPIANTTNSTTLGNNNKGGDAMIGKLDDIGIWNRALTETEITTLYNAIDCIDTITKQPINQTVNINSNVSFIVATTDSLATYQWQSDLGMGFQNISSAGQFNGATNDTLIVSNASMTNNNQNFRCIVSSGNCKDTSSIAKLTVNNNTGINSPSNVNAVKVYPNPASTMLYIDLEKPGYYTAKLSSVAGQAIISPTTGTIDISALANGVYILTIYDSNNKLISTNKVTIVK